LKQIYLIYFLLISTCFSFAQIDSSEHRGTIKIAKMLDSTIISVKVNFVVYDHKKSNVSSTYFENPKWVETSIPVNTTDRIKTLPPNPSSNFDKFDYTEYFRRNAYTKDIKMRQGECDTVTFIVFVDNFGKVKFNDASPMEVLGDTVVVFTDYRKIKYKIDVSHLRTRKALDELTFDKWTPAIILRLKKHPSKYKEKYTTSIGYAQGTIQVVYSCVTFRN